MLHHFFDCNYSAIIILKRHCFILKNKAVYHCEYGKVLITYRDYILYYERIKSE